MDKINGTTPHCVYGMHGGVVVLKTYCGPEVFNKCCGGGE